MKHMKLPKNVEILTFVTTSDGEKREYDAEDHHLSESIELFDVEEVSYMLLFVNGMLQPSTHYTVAQGKLVFLTDDVPEKNVPIILQMVKVR